MKLPDFHRSLAGNGRLLAPRDGLVHVRAFQHPKSAHVRISLKVGPFSDLKFPSLVAKDRTSRGGMVQSTHKNPDPRRDHFIVEIIDGLRHRCWFGGRVVVVSVVDCDEKLGHESLRESD